MSNCKVLTESMTIHYLESIGCKDYKGNRRFNIAWELFACFAAFKLGFDCTSEFNRISELHKPFLDSFATLSYKTDRELIELVCGPTPDQREYERVKKKLNLFELMFDKW